MTAKFRNDAQANGAVVRKVTITAGRYKGQELTFTQHSPDRYTVFGLAERPKDGISIERRTCQSAVRMAPNSARRMLKDTDRWIAHEYRNGCYHGALAVGATAQQAYQNTFDQFNR